MDVADPTSRYRSPYRVSLADLVLHFGTSDPRKEILAGLIRYRRALFAAGIVSGFQWLDGSFLEDVERLEQRAPRDIDVVTFFELPPGRTQRDILAQHRPLFDRSQTKASFRVDAYPACLGGALDSLIERSTYWYSLWAHRRNGQWKGYLQASLDAADDANAQANLNPRGGTLP
jgi:hypothetical protein